MNIDVNHIRQSLAGVARFAALAMIAAIGTSCTTEPVREIGSLNLTTLVQVDPVSRTDTTYIGDVFEIPMPHFRDASGIARGGFNVSRISDNSAIARPSEAITEVKANAYGGEVSFDVNTPDSSMQKITIQPLSAGQAKLSVATVLTDPQATSGLMNGITTPTGAPLVFTHNVVVLQNPPTILNLPSVIRMQVGDTLTLAPMPRGSSGGTVTTGAALWSIEAGTGVVTLHPLYEALFIWPNTPAYPQRLLPALTPGGTGRIGLKARAPGQAELVVVWFSAGGARIQKNITVVVTAPDGPVVFTEGAFFVDDPAREREPVSLGGTRQYKLRDVNGVTIAPTFVDWLTLTDGVASITPNGAAGGLATCLKEGTASILANVASTGDVATAKLLCGVPAAPTATISITPPSGTVKVGSTVTFDATAVDPLVFSNIKWRVAGGNATVVSAVSSTPLTSRVTVLGLKPGQASVIADYGDPNLPSASATAALTVTARMLRLAPSTTPTPVAAGAAQQYTIEEVDAANNRIGTVPAVLFNWDSNPSTVAQVDANGKATCSATGAGGSATITARQDQTGESLTAVLSCSLSASSLPRLAVSPQAASVSQGRTTTIAAVVTNGLNVTDVTWTTKDASIASIADNGSRSVTVAGVKSGSSTYIVGSFAYSGGIARDSALVTVTGAATAAVHHITLEPDSIDVTKGQQVQYRIRFWNSSNAEMNAEVGATILFTEDVSSIAQINATTGLLTTRGVGVTPVTASYRMPYYDAIQKPSLIANAKVVVH